MSAEQFVTAILTDRAPKAAGHYAQAVASGAYVFVSGQLPIRADRTPLDDDSFEAQARQAIQNMLEVVRCGQFAAASGQGDGLHRRRRQLAALQRRPCVHAAGCVPRAQRGSGA